VTGGVPGESPVASPADCSTPPQVRHRPDRCAPAEHPAPRKIKDVKPVYPDGALSGQARGSVVVEAIVGVDGNSGRERSFSRFGARQAALEAIRQWSTPSVLNGVPVAVILTIVVNFAIR
jgi:outer membrane biosynthesis protein TonB